ncbi:MAG TPA: lipoyl(octanoyl) transferase LipB [Myxococcales bacterium]|nr:lipoyl(octanoyl) transferase LipB [Myxococcales bacterium]
MSVLRAHRLGLVEYEDGLALQERFVQARRAGSEPDALLLLQHPPVLTLGRGGKRANVLATPEALARLGVEVFETARGGDVTYHGPGQIVGYPILQLPPGRQDVVRYVRDVEEALIRALVRFGLRAGRIPKWTGAWLGSPESGDARKIAAIGVHLSRWLTSHGFALNVRANLSHFELIVPCGIRGAGVTSMERELGGRAPPDEEVEHALAESVASVFGHRLEWAPEPARTVAVAVVRESPRRQVLLLKRRPERGGFWQVVTGRVEPGESPEQAAAREVQEETGQALPVRALGYEHAFALGDRLPPALTRETAFAARWTGGEVRLSDAEHERHRWVDPDEAQASLPFRGLREAARRALAEG